MADEPAAPRVRRSLCDRPADVFDSTTPPRRVPGVAREVLAGPAARRGRLAVASRPGSPTSASTSTTPTGFDRLVDDGSRRSSKEQGIERAATTSTTSRPSRRRSPRSSPSWAGSGLDHERHDGGWRRIVIEKPFGHDLTSAIRLNREVGKVFRESQVYRIDHYLGKETVRNLLVFRFGNGIFEPIWNRRHIDHVQITVAESIGVESRGAFYEETGASRDFLQNHLLQLMSLVAMEPPATFEADAAPRREGQGHAGGRARWSPTGSGPTSSAASTGPGWVEGKPVEGYREEPEVDPESETETFVAARLEVDDWRWAGVPFYLRSGKRLPKRATEIAIQFKDVPHRLFQRLVRGARAEPARDAHPARRGDHAALRRQGPGARASTSAR